jgi:hypothetical protein
MEPNSRLLVAFDFLYVVLADFSCVLRICLFLDHVATQKQMPGLQAGHQS